MPPTRRRAGLSSSGLSGLDAVIPAGAPTGDNTPTPAATTTSERKEKLAGYVPADLVDSVRDAVAALGSHPEDPRSLSEFLENAARNELARLERERNEGRAFPSRARRQLVPGRRPD